MRRGTLMAGILLTALMPLTACGGEAEMEEPPMAEPVMETEPAVAPPPPSATGTDPMQLLTQTIDAARGGLTNLAASAAVENVRQWQQVLGSANNPALQPIVTDLQALEQELQSQPIDGGRIGQVLQRLGEQTTAAASAADAGTQQRVRELGDMLSQAGSQLAGGM